ncbi:MAG TPA: hypothetical protein PK339_01120 [Flavitalea sp.]|nr:hypothetical protein [Flavitalea sp.]
MQRMVSGILLFLLLFQSFYPLTIIGHYYANRAYISSTLCINIDKPQLECNGKCYLSKKMEKAREQEKQAEGFTVKTELLPYIVTEADLSLGSLNLTLKAVPGHRPQNYAFEKLDSFFHPPMLMHRA